jgi:protein-S-isoprenylcysteine O-methyltransferase Ste14
MDAAPLKKRSPPDPQPRTKASSADPRNPDRTLVALQMTGIFLVFWPWNFRFLDNAASVLLCSAATLLGLAALFENRPGNFRIAPEPRPNARLVRNGPYRWIRHPMYAAVLLAMGGICLYNTSPLNLLGLVAAAFALWRKALREEALLSEKFEAYREYREGTRRFIPFVL